MTSRRQFLSACAGVALAPLTAVASSRDPGLGAAAESRGLLFGCATSNFQLADPAFADAFRRDARILVPEYELKRKAIEPSRGALDFSATDELLTFARRNGMAMRGHTLCWHRANPAWLDDALQTSRDERLLTDYIAAVVSRYRGRMHSWDVVNEILEPKDGRSDGLRASEWLKAFGPGYVDLAFHAARAADPHALLVYNDWGCEAGENDRFRAATIEFLSGALSRGVPVDALGLQGHLLAYGSPVDVAKLRTFLREVVAMGIKVLVTEHDVVDEGGPSDIQARDRAVADASRRFLETVLEEGARTVLTWGLSDRFLDPAPLRERLLGYESRRLPLDSDFERKPMWWAIREALLGAPALE